MNRQTKRKRWRPAPLTVVLFTATLTVVLLLGVGWLNARRYRVRARVEIAEPMSALAEDKHTATAARPPLPDGEVERLAARVREASGLLYGLTLLAVTEQMSRRPVVSVPALLQLLAQRHLAPPGLEAQPMAGALFSARATLYVRYRPQPLGLEVVSVGREQADGPRLIVRLAATSDEQTGALLLLAKADAAVPAPFAALEQVVALGWRLEPLRERASTLAEQERLQQWAEQYAGAGK